MIDRWLSKLELFLLRRAPSHSVSIRSRRYHTIQKDVLFLELFERMQKQGVIIQSVNEANNLWQLCPQTARVEGDVAEVGVYMGGTARLLSQVKGKRRLFLFDTFGECRR